MNGAPDDRGRGPDRDRPDGDALRLRAGGCGPGHDHAGQGPGERFPHRGAPGDERIAAAFVPGSHGSTFGGNPLATAAGIATLETILEEGILENCRKVGEYFLYRLGELKEKHSRIREVRGRGLILAIELTVPGAEFVLKCMEKGTSDQLHERQCPAFCSAPDPHDTDVDKAMGILDEVLEEQ